MYVSLQFKLQLGPNNKKRLLELMRKQSSAIRSAYNMLRKGLSQTEIYNNLRRRYSDMLSAYINSAIYKAKQYPTNRKVVFGGKALFGKLCKSRDKKSKTRRKLKQEWKEKRQGTLISIGSKYKTEKGNRNLRFEQINGELHLKITVGDREFVYAKVLREPSNKKDKWNIFLVMLFESWKSKNYFPYTVELKLREGEIYGNVAFEYPEPGIWLTKEYGVIGIDINASPLHLAIAEVSSNGNKVNPAFTSLIGSLKYAPQLNIDKDVASAFVIGRRALGFKKKMPENYLKLLSDREYLEYALYCYEEKERELKENLKKETNQYKQNAIKLELRELQEKKSLLLARLENLQSEPISCVEANGRNSAQGEVAKTTSQKDWQILKVALLFPVLGRSFAKDFSPLKPFLVQGKWDWVRSRLVPLSAGGTSR